MTAPTAPVGMDWSSRAEKILRHTRAMQRRFAARDQRWDDVRAIRQGKLSDNFPDFVSEAWPEPIVANFIDTTARDLAEMLAPLPTFSCSSVSMRSDTERKRADVRTKIANHYMEFNSMSKQMLYGADHYWSFGMTIFHQELDYEARMPRVTIEDPTGAYPVFDRWGRAQTLTRRWWADAMVLAEAYPELADQIWFEARTVGGTDGTMVELIRYSDAQDTTLVLGGKGARVLDVVTHRLNRLPFVVAKRPWVDINQVKGQFDDVVWIQLARDTLAKLQIEAVERSVQAPLALPPDVQELNYGPDAVLRSQTPEKIRRVGMEMTNMSFLEGNQLLEEMRTGTRYPAARVGEQDSSVITGRGVQALLGGLENQVRAANTIFRDAFMDVVAMCFELDEKVWPNSPKRIKGTAEGIPYDMEYTPSKDIAANTTCDVKYGFAAGLDPTRAILLLLQLRGDELISRDTFQRNLPFAVNVNEENSKVQVENIRGALLQSFAGYVQAIPAMAQMGQDPADAVNKIAAIAKGLQKGRPIEDVAVEVFAPPPAPEPAGPESSEPGVPGGPGAPGGPPAGGMAGGLGPSGLMQGVPAGQAGQAPGGRPDLQMLLGGITGNGKPSMGASVLRRRRV